MWHFVAIGLVIFGVIATLICWSACVVSSRCSEREREIWDELHGTIAPK